MKQMNISLAAFLICATALFGQSSLSAPQSPGSRTSPSKEEQELVVPDKDPPCPKNRNKTAEAKYGEYIIRTYRYPEPSGCVLIRKGGKVVFSLVSTDFKIGGNFFHDKGIPIGTDITGAGTPNAIVGEWTGGAHCCFTLHVFELGETFKEIGVIHSDHSDVAKFVDIDHDGIYEFEGFDWAFAYWGASFMASPAPRIVLKYRDGRFRLATDLMTKPVPSPEEFARIVRLVKTDRDWGGREPDWLCQPDCGTPISLWTNMLDYLYTGHADLAWRLLNESWPPKRQGKREFAEGFCQQLKHSRYWRDLHPWIGPCPGRIRP